MTGDERSYGGRVLDISRGGLRCVVSEPLSPGDVLAISIKSPNPGVIEGRIDAYGEVVRLKRRGSIFELGVQFVRPTAAKELPAERRHHRRADVEFGLTVRTGDGRRELASVRNISAGGLSFSSGSAFDVGEEVALSLGPRRSPGAEGALSSVARIIRVRRLGGHYEVAASFLG